MTTQDTPRRAPKVVRPDEEQPLGDVGGRLRNGMSSWWRSPSFDFYALIAVGTLLVGVGLVMVLSASSVTSIAKGQSGFAGLFRQGRFALIGLAGLLCAAFIPPRIYRRLAWFLLALGLGLQLLVHSPLGVEAQGNRNWIMVAGQTFQPSELLKLSLAVWLGAVLANKRRLLDRAFHILVPAIPVVGVALALVIAGKDLGTMMIMVMLVAGALWVAGVPRRWFALGATVGVVGVVTLAVTSANRMARISSWLHGTCTGSTCDQPRESMLALASGGWWGIGLGESRQKWGRLPAAEDDYIFAIIGEELGLIGTLTVLALFTLLALILFRMIARAEDPFVQITVGGVAAWLIGQAFVNMMVVTGLLPVLGVPLPFISSGGSALIASMLALGMLISFARFEPGAREAISARVGSVRRSSATVPASKDGGGTGGSGKKATGDRASGKEPSGRGSGGGRGRRGSGRRGRSRAAGSSGPRTGTTRSSAGGSRRRGRTSH
jgi:cell division protein FtsW